jgi:glycosyltransferase involved in cell wall biosynthesis
MASQGLAVTQSAAQARPAVAELQRHGPALRTARRLRVMQVVPTLDPGGTERLVIEIVKSLSDAVDSVVCCLDRKGSWAQELVDRGVAVETLDRRAGFHPELGRQIARLAAEGRIDVLHCHHYSPFVYGQLAALLNRRLRVIFTEHGRLSDAGPSLRRRLVNPLFGRLPEAIYAVSNDLRRHMIAEGLPGGRVGVIHNGIDPGSRPTPADRAAARAAMGVDGGAFLLGTAGRLDPVKDIPTLLQAFAAVRWSRPDARLVVIGDGSARESLEGQIRGMSAASAITLTGYRGDARRLLSALDVYVNSSTHEGVSLTILEAMAAGIPVVATHVGGTPEVVLEGETGLLVPARAPQSLASAIEALAGAPGTRRSMGEAGRFRVKRHFSVEAMVGRYLNAYRGQAA